MDKLVIYKNFFGYKVTNEKNYNRAIQDASEIINCNNFTSPDAIIEYFIKYFNKKIDDFIIINE